MDDLVSAKRINSFRNACTFICWYPELGHLYMQYAICICMHLLWEYVFSYCVQLCRVTAHVDRSVACSKIPACLFAHTRANWEGQEARLKGDKSILPMLILDSEFQEAAVGCCRRNFDSIGWVVFPFSFTMGALGPSPSQGRNSLAFCACQILGVATEALALSGSKWPTTQLISARRGNGEVRCGVQARQMLRTGEDSWVKMLIWSPRCVFCILL